MLDILHQWNRWGAAQLPSGYRRDVMSEIKQFIDTPDIVALVGLRRAGKTTVLYQIMDELETKGVPPEAMLHLNFEEPAIAPKLSLETLDDIYQTYREQVYPTGTAYLFFDEIQNVPDWEKWVRARHDNEAIKIFITGSSAQLMSRELATVLTGRHVEFYVTPLSFKELLRVKSITIPSTQYKINPPPHIQYALTEYMTWGGLPEVVLSDNNERKSKLLKQYFDDVLFKDVAMRHQVRDVRLLRNIAVHLITQTASLFSISRLAKLFQISQHKASNYCQFIQEAFLVDYLPYFSLKTAERQRHPQKVHVNDVGLRHIASVSLTQDYGRLAETLVYQHIQRQAYGYLFYWKGQQEIDFVVQKGNDIQSVIQVAYDNLDKTRTRGRELASLDEAQAVFSGASTQLVVGKMPQSPDKRMIPLWLFLLDDGLF